MPDKRPIASLAVLAIIIVVIILAGSFLSPVGAFFRSLANPVAAFAYRITERLNPRSDSNISENDFERTLNELREENARLSAENARLNNLEDENRRLRNYFDFAQTQTKSLQLAQIIARGRPEDSWRNRDVITLNQGANQGIAVGMPIISSQGVLVGKITAVKSNVAEACLLYSSDCRLSAAISGQGSTIGVAHGDLGISVIVEFIPQDKEISEKQMIVSSGLEGNMPSGLLIGTVSRVVSEANKLWKSAVIDPAANFDDLRFVAILK